MVLPKVAKILSNIIEIAPEDISPDTALTPEIITPIQIAKLVIECERRFKIIIHDEDVHTFKRVDDVAAYIDTLLDEGDLNAVDPDRNRDAWYYC